MGLVNGGMANLENMNPDLKVLVAQLADPNSDLSQQGIRLYNRETDGEMMVEFEGNRLESQYDYNIRMAKERGDFIKPSEVTGGGPELEEGQPSYEKGRKSEKE